MEQVKIFSEAELDDDRTLEEHINAWLKKQSRITITGRLMTHQINGSDWIVISIFYKKPRERNARRK